MAMDEILKNTSIFLKILCSCRSRTVDEWDTGNVSRALKWCEYFERVASKLQDRPTHCVTFERHLKVKCQELELSIHARPLTSKDFVSIRLVLITWLLSNPHLPNALFLHVIKELREQSAKGKQADVVEFIGDLISQNELTRHRLVLLEALQINIFSKMTCSTSVKDLNSYGLTLQSRSKASNIDRNFPTWRLLRMKYSSLCTIASMIWNWLSAFDGIQLLSFTDFQVKMNSMLKKSEYLCCLALLLACKASNSNERYHSEQLSQKIHAFCGQYITDCDHGKAKNPNLCFEHMPGELCFYSSTLSMNISQSYAIRLIDYCVSHLKEQERPQDSRNEETAMSQVIDSHFHLISRQHSSLQHGNQSFPSTIISVAESRKDCQKLKEFITDKLKLRAT